MAAAPLSSSHQADPIERSKRRRLSTRLLHAMDETLPQLRDEQAAIRRALADLQRGTPTDLGEIPSAAGTFQGSPEAAATLRNLSLMSPEELDAEATDPQRRMRALVKSEIMAGYMAEQAALSGKYHWAKQFMEHQRRCGDTLQKLRREAAIKSKSLPPDWDNLRRWIIHDLKKHPEALELFYQRMDQYEEGKMPRFEPGGVGGEDVSEDTAAEDSS